MHDFISDLANRYRRARRHGMELTIGSESVRRAMVARLDIADQAIEITGTVKQDGDLLKHRHDLAGTALRLSLLSRSLSRDTTNWFDGDSLSPAERADILTAAQADTANFPILSYESSLATVMAARKQDETPAEQRHSVRAYLSVWRDADERTSTESNLAFGSPDALFVQAFGRDSFEDSELPVVAHRRAVIGNDTDTLDTLSDEGFAPGPANEALAETTRARVEEFGIETMAQWEVAAALRMQDAEWYDRYVSAIHVLWPRGQFYPTYDVKADSITLLKQRQLYTPLELAHAGMVPRAQAIIRKQGVISDVARHEVPVPYDPHSTQPWVRNASVWRLREAATRAHHVFFGKVTF